MGDFFQYMDWQDLLALLFFIFAWIGYARYSEHESRVENNLLAVTNHYRMLWMREMIRRDNRSTDAIMVGNLQRSISFFANTTIFILLGLMTMLSYHDRASAIIGNIPLTKPVTPFMWEVKIFLLIIIFIYAFFKYTWSLRQYNYAGIFICATPPHNECNEDLEALTAKGSELVSNAAHHFNKGLRAYYFGLAALAWFIHPFLFILATAWVIMVTHRREYRSATLKNLSK
jgi:uncharacterized membrane protein